MRRGLWIVLLFTASGFSAALAQEIDWERFYPLEVGDTWDYRASEMYCFIQECDTGFDGYERRTVVADTVIAGEPWSVLRVERLALDGAVLDTSRCVARVSAEGEVDFEPVSGPCDVLERRDAIGDLWNLQEAWDDVVPAVVEIGGIEYGVDVLRFYRVGQMGETTFSAATDIGVIEYRGNAGQGGSMDFWSGELVYARVGGVPYGGAPVTTEETTVPAAFALGAAYPNPFRSTAALSLTLPAVEAVALEVFDVLGRPVLRRDLGVQPAGPSQHRLDLVHAPAGLYIVRATTASGETATRRLVKVD